MNFTSKMAVFSTGKRESDHAAYNCFMYMQLFGRPDARKSFLF